MITDTDVAQLDRAAEQEVDSAVAFAEAGSWEPVDQRYAGVPAPATQDH